MSRVKYVDVPRHAKLEIKSNQMGNIVKVSAIERCMKWGDDDTAVRLLPDGQLKDGCYIHARLANLVPLADRLMWPFSWREEGAMLIVLDGLYYIAPSGAICPDFKQYPTYPGGVVHRRLLAFRDRRPDHEYRRSDEILAYWEFKEGEEHRDFYRTSLRLRRKKLKIRQAKTKLSEAANAKS